MEYRWLTIDINRYLLVLHIEYISPAKIGQLFFSNMNDAKTIVCQKIAE